MVQQPRSSRLAPCMKCSQVTPLYFGEWGEGGLCKSCIDGMRPAGRVEILRHMKPRDHERWRLDALWTEQGRATKSGREGFALTTRPGDRQRERRVYSRVEARVPVSLAFSPESFADEHCQHKKAHCVSRDISVGGVRVLGQDPSLLELRIETRLRMDVALPPPAAEVLTCEGVVRNVLEGEGDAEYLGIEFRDLSRVQLAVLHRFLANPPANELQTSTA